MLSRMWIGKSEENAEIRSGETDAQAYRRTLVRPPPFELSSNINEDGCRKEVQEKEKKKDEIEKEKAVRRMYVPS